MENTIITIGREGDQPFTITGSKVSRKHCAIEVKGETWTLRDLRPESGILQYRPDDESPVYDQFDIDDDRVDIELD